MLDAQALADLYVAAWNEPDAAKRSSAIAALWAPDALGPRGAGGYAALTKLTLATPGKSARQVGEPVSVTLKNRPQAGEADGTVCPTFEIAASGYPLDSADHHILWRENTPDATCFGGAGGFACDCRTQQISPSFSTFGPP